MFKLRCDCDGCRRARSIITRLLIVVFTLAAAFFVAADVGIRK
jgi:hypothetical protein